MIYPALHKAFTVHPSEAFPQWESNTYSWLLAIHDHLDQIYVLSSAPTCSICARLLVRLWFPGSWSQWACRPVADQSIQVLPDSLKASEGLNNKAMLLIVLPGSLCYSTTAYAKRVKDYSILHYLSPFQLSPIHLSPFQEIARDYVLDGIQVYQDEWRIALSFIVIHSTFAADQSKAYGFYGWVVDILAVCKSILC